MLKIEFGVHGDGADTEAQARAVVAALVGLYGASVLPTNVRYGGKLSDNLAQSTAPPAWANGPQVTRLGLGMTEDFASDGYPEPDADMDAPDPTSGNIYGNTDKGGVGPDGMVARPSGALDSAGIPWDERIHASTKTTNKDGTWTRRRNTPDATFDAVMAELRGAAPPPPPPAAPEVPAPLPSAADAFGAVPPPPPPAAPEGNAPGFLDLLKRITALQAAGKMSKEQLDGMLAACGVEGFGKLTSASADARAAVGAVLDSMA